MTADATITAELLAWYDRNRRHLPWRALPGEPSNPYSVWLSEVMLQQTTVQAVKPYFTRFITQWPTVTDLAAAPVDDVMRAWAGLGYYSRARNLHAAAVVIQRDHGGRFPGTEAGLRSLPGVGVYTAAAIAAIAFGQHATVVDGNVERVMSRTQAIDEPSARASTLVRAAMEASTPHDRAGDFAQAVMDLGAMICTPKNPSCTICPISNMCTARRLGMQGTLPRRKVKRSLPLRHGVVFYVVLDGGEVLVRRRPPSGLLGGMIELPGSSWSLVQEAPATHQIGPAMRSAGRVTHTFTHFRLLLDVVVTSDSAAIPADYLTGAWPLPKRALQSEALPTLMRNAITLAETQTTNLPDPAPASRRHRRS